MCHPAKWNRNKAFAVLSLTNLSSVDWAWYEVLSVWESVITAYRNIQPESYSKILLNIWPEAWHSLVYTCNPRIWQLMTRGVSGIQGYSWLCEFKATWAKKERRRGMGKEVKKGKERTNWSKLFIVSFWVHVFEHLRSQPGKHFSQTLIIQSTLSSRSPVTSLCHAESWWPLSEAHLPAVFQPVFPGAWNAPKSLSLCFLS